MEKKDFFKDELGFGIGLICLISFFLTFLFSIHKIKTNPVLLKKEIVTACRYSHEDISTCVERATKALEVNFR